MDDIEELRRRIERLERATYPQIPTPGTPGTWSPIGPYSPYYPIPIPTQCAACANGGVCMCVRPERVTC